MSSYRKEIDGLRAIAVLSVILCHANFRFFEGGYIGVDIFFVISGYLITKNILQNINNSNFSLLGFYKKRVLRILPTLYLVILVCNILSYWLMMPDELKNYGQSILATSLFSNNILLWLTSGYWDLTSEFKPLLHTWSLGVEEQFYLLYPFILIYLTKNFKDKLLFIIVIITVLSYGLAYYLNNLNPLFSFYLLPTRVWELLLGAIISISNINRKPTINGLRSDSILSIIGLLMIAVSIILFSKNNSAPAFILVPTIGTVLILFYANENTITNKILSFAYVKYIGIISYSLYIWHQPIFAFAKIYSINPPSNFFYAVCIIVCFFLAFFTWKFVEEPARRSVGIFSNTIILILIILTIANVAYGFYLNKTYGISTRFFDPPVEIKDIDKRFYNERVFSFKSDNFINDGRLKILVIGNSYGRDFVNMNLETFNNKKIELIYRDDMTDCIESYNNRISQDLYNQSNIIIFASGYNENCLFNDINHAEANKKNIFYLGFKQFGYNLNWLIRLNSKERANLYNPILSENIDIEYIMQEKVPAKNYISIIKPIVKDGKIPITDSDGMPLSTDRNHLTKFGAIYLGREALLKSNYGLIIQNLE